ncbi:hypothetical protein CEXT_155171 [Caerostris extrusa]|uniref:Uncharacterized protein n=1 Tax=Caerostris extrusa TaxID=172846 RepID=A0AAV4THI8_CAEEX|nr:hypothetical protein CEXT_155171 [Caerostris extrusa]
MQQLQFPEKLFHAQTPEDTKVQILMKNLYTSANCTWFRNNSILEDRFLQSEILTFDEISKVCSVRSSKVNCYELSKKSSITNDSNENISKISRHQNSNVKNINHVNSSRKLQFSQVLKPDRESIVQTHGPGSTMKDLEQGIFISIVNIIIISPRIAVVIIIGYIVGVKRNGNLQKDILWNSTKSQKLPEKVTALIKMPRSTNVQEVRSFLGMVTYSRFLANNHQLFIHFDIFLERNRRYDGQLNVKPLSSN